MTPLKTPPALVIFDCDGVLVDSETISLAVLTETVVRHGGRLTADEARDRFLGRSASAVVAALEAEFGFRYTDDHHTETRDNLFARFRAELKAIEGVREVLERLPVPACVASSSAPERLRLALDVTGLLPLLDPRLFSAALVPRGKPAPDLFLHAARAMNAAPETCVVVEDSPVGLQAVRAAGMTALAFTGGSHAGSPAHRAALDAQDPVLVFERMSDLPALLGFAAATEKLPVIRHL